MLALNPHLELTLIIVAAIATHFVSILRFIHSGNKWKPWRDALKSYKCQHSKWRKSTSSSNGHFNNITENTAESDPNPKECLPDDEADVGDAHQKLEEQRAAVQDQALSILRSRLNSLCGSASECKSQFPTLAIDVWNSFKSIIEWIEKHYWIAGLTLTVSALMNDYFYYDRFDFNVLPYYSEFSTAGFIILALYILAISIIFLLCFLATLFLVYLTIIIVILLTILLAFTVTFSLGISSIIALWAYSRSVRLSGLILFVVTKWDMIFSKLRPETSLFTSFVICVLKFTHKVSVVAVRVLFVVLAIASLMYIVLGDPSYRAYAAVTNPSRIRVVVNDPPDGFKNSLIKIGSSGGYVIAVSVKDCSQSGSRSHANDAPFSTFKLKFCLRWKFLFEPKDVGCTSSVIALPGSRVHCTYEENSLQGDVLCAQLPHALGDSEVLLQRQLLNKAEGCVDPIVSAPFVFMPGRWESPISLPSDWVDYLKRRYDSGEQEAAGQPLYVFGLASSDGLLGSNKRLAQDRVQTILKLIELQFEDLDLNIKKIPLGEIHLTQAVADSRSVRLVYCAQNK